ncbi:HNH endonuclease [Streptomyces sp. NPDC056697]|uniref:HNH endonuclease signature motif containing protein n=1 Tax=Streptomyces sp. NPDC056697 TaxID=3345915 RepID=UPI0036CED05F
MPILELCAGYGGLGIAVEALTGDKVTVVAEVHGAACKVMAHRFPDAPNVGDVTMIDWRLLTLEGQADRRRRDERASAMYERYTAGLSLAEVADEFGVTRQSVHGRFKGRGWELRKRPAPLAHVEFNGRKYTLRNTGYYGATSGSRSLMHRDVWEFHNGPVPDGCDIHHLDHDRTNNDISNLACLTKDEHTRLHHAERVEEVVPLESPVIDTITAGFP